MTENNCIIIKMMWGQVSDYSNFRLLVPRYVILTSWESSVSTHERSELSHINSNELK